MTVTVLLQAKESHFLSECGRKLKVSFHVLKVSYQMLLQVGRDEKAAEAGTSLQAESWRVKESLLQTNR